MDTRCTSNEPPFRIYHHLLYLLYHGASSIAVDFAVKTKPDHGAYPIHVRGTYSGSVALEFTLRILKSSRVADLIDIK